MVSVRRGIRFASPATAAASVGASTAPNTHAARGSIPNACAVNDTAAIVAITNTTLNSTITRRLARISRRLVFRLSQYRMAGRNSSSTTSGSSSTADSAGISPSSPPNPSSSTGGATR